MLPEIFKIGTFFVSGYLFFFTLGIISASLVIFFLAKKEQLDCIEILNFIIFAIISILFGSKLYGVIYNYISKPGYYRENPGELFKHFLSGGVFYGGLMVLVIFSFFYLRRFLPGKDWNIIDITTIGGVLGHVFGRIGCFMAGCCYGHPTDLPWGVKFPFQGGKPHPFADTFVHPTQIYEALLNLFNFIFLLFIYKKKRFNGQIFSLYLINYGFIRLFVEYFRNDGGRGYLFKGNIPYLSLSYPQVISVVLIILGIILYRVKNKSRGRLR